MLYPVWEKMNYAVNVVVNNGVVDENDTSSKTAGYNDSVSFNLLPNETNAYGTVSCSNGQTATLTNNTLKISSVTGSTTCTVTYATTSTVLYTDGTLIINEKASDRVTNTQEHGAVTNTYAAMSSSNNYVIVGQYDHPWNNERNSITRVEIGQRIQPIDPSAWCYNLVNLRSGDFANLDTSIATRMVNMFDNAGYNSSVTSFVLTGLNNWDVSNVTEFDYMFGDAGYYATTWSIGDLSSWNSTSATSMNNMFSYAGYNATSLTSIGTLKVYANNMNAMFSNARYMKATLNIYSNPTSYASAFNTAATQSGGLITVNYSDATTNIDNIIATKSSGNNVVKGSLLS